ncbi:hypothetical protein Mia14_0459 [Candidatus Mancarchaeum acidiphilum]|uniref:Uncharacterized protein n=1 Tax=Candidatus Mancarchaeum acidiphilum TaxID=1920749 RepID=A0A218NMU9_9ARCH|nr:hypothetical protein [Candidatus Mancarchaeum acidiphilum]ASI13776.1 hypothetical protein Mia14_0459 [Candidatus Mancarchaeum acidiphilum]
MKEHPEGWNFTKSTSSTPAVTYYLLTSPQNLYSSLYDNTGISMSSRPLDISMQGTAGQYNGQLGELPLGSSNEGIRKAIMQSPLTLYTNTTQTSSSGVTPLQYLGDIVSTVGSLVRPFTTILNPGTPGGAPLAGGSFPSNYPFKRTNINKLIRIIQLVYLN